MAKMIRKRDMIAPGFFVPIKTLQLPKLPEGLTENIPSWRLRRMIWTKMWRNIISKPWKELCTSFFVPIKTCSSCQNSQRVGLPCCLKCELVRCHFCDTRLRSLNLKKRTSPLQDVNAWYELKCGEKHPRQKYNFESLILPGAEFFSCENIEMTELGKKNKRKSRRTRV